MKITPIKLVPKLNFFLPAFLFCFFSMESLTLTAQVGKGIIQKKDSIFLMIERMPEYPGGVDELLGFLQKNVHYPSKAKKKGIQGMVLVEFMVERDGSISNTKVVKSIGGGCDEAALAAFKNMPKWSPGLKTGGEPVRVQYRLPIGFHLE